MGISIWQLLIILAIVLEDREGGRVIDGEVTSKDKDKA